MLHKMYLIHVTGAVATVSISNTHTHRTPPQTPLHNLHCSRYPAPPSLLLPPQLIHLSLSLAYVTHRVSVATETNDALSALVLMQAGC